jgi:hypothetical protein
MKKLTLTSVNQLIELVKNNSNLATEIPALAPIAGLQLSTTPQKTCNCAANKKIVTPDANKQLAEQILSSLTESDFSKIKNVLNLYVLCYYKRNTEQNKLELICV